MKREIPLFKKPSKKFEVVSTDEKTGYAAKFTFSHTDHSRQRAAQRGIDQLRIAATIEYGDTVSKQGVLFCILGEDRIPEKLQKQKDKLKNTIVILSEDTDTVITCYRARHPYKQIRVKTKLNIKDLKRA